MNNEQIILITFRLINFAVLIGLAIFLWKKYLRAAVVSGYEQEQDHLASLNTKYTHLRQQERALQKKAANDEQARAELKERLFAWREAVDKERQEMQARKKKRVAVLEKTIQEQVKRVSQNRLYQSVQNEAVKEARNMLQKQFADSKKQKSALQAIVKRMEVA